MTVSDQIDGRAEGGMADTIRRRPIKPDEFLDERLAPAAAAHRALCRTELRRAFDDPTGDFSRIATRLSLGKGITEDVLQVDYFGMAWEQAECSAPTLCYRRVPVAELSSEMATANTILARLRRQVGEAVLP